MATTLKVYFPVCVEILSILRSCAIFSNLWPIHLLGLELPNGYLK